jgi:hypothetical protein
MPRFRSVLDRQRAARRSPSASAASASRSSTGDAVARELGRSGAIMTPPATTRQGQNLRMCEPAGRWDVNGGTPYVPIWRARWRSPGDILCARSVRGVRARIWPTRQPIAPAGPDQPYSQPMRRKKKYSDRQAAAITPRTIGYP